MNPILTVNNYGVFEFRNPTPEISEALESFGFVKDKITKLWTTRYPGIAYQASQYAEIRIKQALERMKRTREASRSLSGESKLRKPPSGFSYFPYQISGVEFLKKHKKALLADEPGSGKTIMTAGLINECMEIWNVLILCPASLRLNWEKELNKWLIDPLGNLDIVSYDSAWRSKHFSRLMEQKYDIVVMDEAHYIKHDTSKRSMAAQALSKNAERIVMLTGTPVENTPSDVFPILHTLNEKMFPDFMSFARRYCGAFLQEVRIKGRLKKVWNTSGSSNEQELQDILRSTMMIRRLKKDVLPQLPKKIHQIIEIENKEKVVKAEANVWKTVCHKVGFEEALTQLENGGGVAFSEMAGIRQELALTKIPYVVEHLDNLLKSVDKVVVFAHHKAIVQALMESLEGYNPVKLVGGMSDQAKNESVEHFQTDPSCRVFVGNFLAAGVGHTLTASSNVVHVEYPNAKPAMYSQAEDRCCRIGAKADSVLVQHIVLNGSLDVHFANKIVRKQEIADKILDI